MNCKECFYFVEVFDEEFKDLGGDGHCYLNPPVMDLVATGKLNADDGISLVDLRKELSYWVRPVVWGEHFCGSFKGKNS